MWIIRTIVVCVLFIAIYQPSLAAEKKGSGVAPSDQIGRYQLILGKYKYATNMYGEALSTDGVFKLDTVTGKLYLCTQSQSSEYTKDGNILYVRTCVDFEQTWEVAPQPPQPARK